MYDVFVKNDISAAICFYQSMARKGTPQNNRSCPGTGLVLFLVGLLPKCATQNRQHVDDFEVLPKVGVKDD